MDGNISEMLKGVLSDPDAMKKLMDVAGNLMGSGGGPAGHKESGGAAEAAGYTERDSPPPPPPPPRGDKGGRGRPGDECQIALIASLKPYLSPERRKTADSMIQILKLVKLTDINKLLKG